MYRHIVAFRDDGWIIHSCSTNPHNKLLLRDFILVSLMMMKQTVISRVQWRTTKNSNCRRMMAITIRKCTGKYVKHNTQYFLRVSLKFKGCSFATSNVPHNHRLIKGAREEKLPFSIPSKGSYGAIVSLRVWKKRKVTWNHIMWYCH